MIKYTSLEFIVASDEVDYKGRLFLPSLVEKLQIANAINSNVIGLTDEIFKEKNVNWMLMNDHMILKKPLPTIGDRVFIETVSTDVKGAKFYREDFVYLNEVKEENLIVHNGSIWIIADRDTHIPRRPSFVCDKDEIKKQADLTLEFAKSIKDLNPKSDLKEDQKIFDYLALYSDIDANLHMHNTTYIGLALDAIVSWEMLDVHTQDILVEEIQIRYMREILLNELVNIYLVKEDEYYHIEGKNAEGESSFIVKAKVKIG